jgi:hypothetical protein
MRILIATYAHPAEEPMAVSPIVAATPSDLAERITDAFWDDSGDESDMAALREAARDMAFRAWGDPSSQYEAEGRLAGHDFRIVSREV